MNDETKELLKRSKEVYHFIDEIIKTGRFSAEDVNDYLDNIVQLAANMDRNYDLIFDIYGETGKTGYANFHYIEGHGVNQLNGFGHFNQETAARMHTQGGK